MKAVSFLNKLNILLNKSHKVLLIPIVSIPKIAKNRPPVANYNDSCIHV